MNQKNLVAILGVAVVILLGTTIYFAITSNVSQSVPSSMVKQPATPVQPVANQPVPTTSQAIEKAPQEVISDLLKEDKNIAITILKSSSNYILASISAKPGSTVPVPGYMLWVANINGEWKKISTNNGECDKKLLTKNSFPNEWIVEYKCL